MSFTTAIYHEHNKNMKPAKPCRKVAPSLPAEKFFAGEEEDNTNRETK